MSSFRRYGGLNFSANNNFTRSYISNSEQMNINNYSGLQNSKEIFACHVDMSGNSILHMGTIYFQDGTSMSTAGNAGPVGPEGAQGAAGPQGAQGATGFGVAGAQGAQGATGAQGAQGATGAQGAQGATGAQGTQGFTGAQGAAGAQGTNYWTGTQGGIYYNDGNVGIGVTGPYTKLQVNGDCAISKALIMDGLQNERNIYNTFYNLNGNTGNTNVGVIYAEDTGAYPIYYINNNQSGNHVFIVRENDGDPTYSPLVISQQNVDINGTLNIRKNDQHAGGNITAVGTITVGSDYRLKQDIKPLQLEEYNIDNLNPVYFKYKSDNKESLGLIAHELQEEYPFLVNGAKDGPNTQTVNYNGLIAVLIKEIQQLKKRITTLENKIEFNT